MNLLILNGPGRSRAASDPKYRGTYRVHPTYCESVPEEHEINKLFFWFLEEGGELGVVGDLLKALRYAQLLNDLASSNPSHFEVVEVADGDSAPICDGTFLGFDLSSGYNNSLLAWGFRQFPGGATLPEPIHELNNLINRHYAPQLNAAGLFDTYDVANSCLRSMIALQDLFPNLFEGGDLRDFRTVGLYRISAED